MPVELIAKIAPKNSAFVNIVDAVNVGIDSSGFILNLKSTDDTLQKFADRVDGLMSFANLDGGKPDSNFGGIDPISGGGVV